MAGLSNDAVVHKFDFRQIAAKRRKRFVKDGLTGLGELPRRGPFSTETDGGAIAKS